MARPLRRRAAFLLQSTWSTRCGGFATRCLTSGARPAAILNTMTISAAEAVPPINNNSSKTKNTTTTLRKQRKQQKKSRCIRPSARAKIERALAPAVTYAACALDPAFLHALVNDESKNASSFRRDLSGHLRCALLRLDVDDPGAHECDGGVCCRVPQCRRSAVRMGLCPGHAVETIDRMLASPNPTRLLSDPAHRASLQTWFLERGDMASARRLRFWYQVVDYKASCGAPIRRQRCASIYAKYSAGAGSCGNLLERLLEGGRGPVGGGRGSHGEDTGLCASKASVIRGASALHRGDDDNLPVQDVRIGHRSHRQRQPQQMQQQQKDEVEEEGQQEHLRHEALERALLNAHAQVQKELVHEIMRGFLPSRAFETHIQGLRETLCSPRNGRAARFEWRLPGDTRIERRKDEDEEKKKEAGAGGPGRGSRHSSFSSATTASSDTDVGSTPRRSDMSTATATTSWVSSAAVSTAASPRWEDEDDDIFCEDDEGPRDSAALFGALPLDLSALPRK